MERRYRARVLRREIKTAGYVTTNFSHSLQNCTFSVRLSYTHKFICQKKKKLNNIWFYCSYMFRLRTVAIFREYSRTYAACYAVSREWSVTYTVLPVHSWGTRRASKSLSLLFYEPKRNLSSHGLQIQLFTLFVIHYLYYICGTF
jgi:hypothetical protein